MTEFDTSSLAPCPNMPIDDIFVMIVFLIITVGFEFDTVSA